MNINTKIIVTLILLLIFVVLIGVVFYVGSKMIDNIDDIFNHFSDKKNRIYTVSEIIAPMDEFFPILAVLKIVYDNPGVTSSEICDKFNMLETGVSIDFPTIMICHYKNLIQKEDKARFYYTTVFGIKVLNACTDKTRWLNWILNSPLIVDDMKLNKEIRNYLESCFNPAMDKTADWHEHTD